MAPRNRPNNLGLEEYNYKGWLFEDEDEESTDKNTKIS